nr:hypothetical protein [Novosphingobium sp. LASN5T]
MNLGFQLIDGHPVFQVAIEAVRLLDQDCLNSSVLAQETDHLAETGSTALLSGLDIDIFAGNDEAAHFGVFAQQLELCRDGEALALLFA